MIKNRPLRTDKIKRSNNVREQIRDAVEKRKSHAQGQVDKLESDMKYYQDQLNKGNEKVERLKG